MFSSLVLGLKEGSQREEGRVELRLGEYINSFKTEVRFLTGTFRFLGCCITVVSKDGIRRKNYFDNLIKKTSLNSEI